MNFEIRDYRTRIASEKLIPFRVVLRESDLLILAEKDLSQEALKLLYDIRQELENYIARYPLFLNSLKPLPFDSGAPPLVQKMLKAGRLAGVGPMAAVAGAIAQELGERLINFGLTREVVVENGGDVYLSLKKEATVAIWAANSPISGRLGLRIKKGLMPCGVCTSSGTVGHSLSLGKADALCVIAKDTALADACATALGNLVKTPKDFKKLKKAASKIDHILGVVCVLGDKLFAQGKAIELVPLKT
ncbi:UPF0280 family protein [Thermodesulfatator autotrophicus]|uniref:Thiamine biosynthesis protein ApbE n=1 Tax=Thermodesulfatator autotrophicus TaxID=1795632 RepID=A0A177E5W6_9BACT|nr:UPF0280 family protein [Thermodesulfatator autotrophicus]OAG27106.1 thiamine biosynthesis protein ApbE [Thermodesulfatator autotrophicus]